MVGTVSRRGLLAAGGAVLLVGCGAPADPPPDDLLLAPSLAAALALADAYDALGRRGLAAEERAHAERLRAAGARPGAKAPSAGTVAATLDLERFAMRAHVHAAGLVRDLRTRTLTAELLSADARHASLLLERLGRDPLPSAFPDGRDA